MKICPNRLQARLFVQKQRELPIAYMYPKLDFEFSKTTLGWF